MGVPSQQVAVTAIPDNLPEIMEPRGDEFNFSEDLMGGLSQMSTQLLSQSSAVSDCTWNSGDSQSFNVLPKRMDQIVPSGPYSEIKKAEISNRTKPLSKYSAEENQRLRHLDL